MKIEALLFDLGKVLIDFNFETGVQALHASCSISRDRFEEVLWDETWIRRYERGEISTGEFHSYLCETAALKMDLIGFRDVWSSVFLPGLLVSEDLLGALKKRYPLILVSNTNEAHFEFIRSRYPVVEFFDEHVLSYEVGSLKPDRKIFEQAIRVSGCAPEALFFTDDREENILAARELGIRAHQFRTERKLIEALQEAGVEISDSIRA
ncbi:MAG TPA: HAD family phosphatase [Terriglobia bacterium]|nr:HAD family phosphatase [Terriglobia bacterium]